MLLTTAFLGAAHIHTPDFIRRINARGQEIRVKSVYDIDMARAKARAATFETPAAVGTVDAIINDPEITSVVICSETNQHRDLVVRAAEAGKHIFCEKPLGLGEADTKAMALAIQKSNVTFQTGFFQRGSPINQFIKREVQAGNLGRITRARFTNCHQAALDGWFDTDWHWVVDTKLSGGGAMLDMGAHALDLIINIVVPSEGEVVSVAASLGNQGGRYGDKIDEYGTGLLTFASGASAVIEASWIDPKLRSPIEIFGTEGQILMDSTGVHYYSKRVDDADGHEPITNLPKGAPHAFELFWDALLGKPLPIPLVTIEEAALGSILMERLYKAAGRSTTEAA